MQFEQLEGGARNPLPKPSIDTGMGLERVAAVLQGKHDNYDIDLFVALIRAIAELTGADPQGPQKASLRVIADHLRASSFLIADGVLPSNEGRGYVLRRIMRRAMRHAQLLGAQGAADVAAGLGAGARDGPGLSGTGARRKPDRGNAAARGDPLPQDAGARACRFSTRRAASLKKGDMFDGETAFTLYDTYGFPLDLTQDALRVARHRRRYRVLHRCDGPAARQGARVMGGLRRHRDRERSGFRCARNSAPPNFSATRPRPPKAWSRPLVKDGKEVDSLKAGESGAIVLNQTPFYGESGGQVGDTGVLTGEGVRVPRHRHAEEGRRSVRASRHRRAGHAEAGTALRSRSITRGARAIRANHSATHLLHEALRQVLGDHIAQRGSLVAPDRLRFDFVASEADHAGRTAPRRGHRQRCRAGEWRGHDAADGGGRCARRRRAGAVRREIRRRGARGVDGQDRTRARRATRSAGRSNCAAAPMCAHRRHRPDLGDRRERGGVRRAPHRGADRAHARQQPTTPSRSRRLRRPNCAPRSTTCRRGSPR